MNGPLPLASSSNGRVSGKSWKPLKTATVRSNLPDGVKTKSWEERMKKTQKALAIKKLETELKDEKQAEFQRYSPSLSPSLVADIVHRRKAITLERKQHAEEKRRLEEAKAQVRTLPRPCLAHSHSSRRLDGRPQGCASPQKGWPYKENQPLILLFFYQYH